MEKTWVLITNAERARCFERHVEDHSLTELIDFVHPHVTLASKIGEGDLTGAAGKGHGRTPDTLARSLNHTPKPTRKSVPFSPDKSRITSMKGWPGNAAMC